MWIVLVMTTATVMSDDDIASVAAAAMSRLTCIMSGAHLKWTRPCESGEYAEYVARNLQVTTQMTKRHDTASSAWP